MKSSLARAIFVTALIGASTASAQISEFAGSPNSPASGVPNESPGVGPLTIALRVYDFVHLDPWVLQSAEKIASEIFGRTGIETAWLNCPALEQCVAEAEHPQFRLEIVPNINGVVKDDTLGFALPCDQADHVCLSYLLYSPIRAFAAQHGTNPSHILGHVMAHEIGHALLGPNAHAPTGIMQGRLPRLDMGRVLYFTDVQSQHLRADLVDRIGALKSRLHEQKSDFGLIPSRFTIEGNPGQNAERNPPQTLGESPLLPVTNKTEFLVYRSTDQSQ